MEGCLRAERGTLSTDEVMCDDDRSKRREGVNGGHWILISAATGTMSVIRHLGRQVSECGRSSWGLSRLQ